MYSAFTSDSALTRNVLQSLGSSWDTRVAVRKDRLDLDTYYDPDIPDFPISMVPFWDKPEFARLDKALKHRFLAAAWIAYNEKAIYLEDEIVQPACALLFRGRFPGVSDPQIKQVIAQIQVDEQFHILMCLDICNIARTRHELQDFAVPEPLIGVLMKNRLRGLADRKDDIARLAYASVAEMSINAYLNQVAGDMTIQPLNRINTDLHRRDESAHGVGFSEIVGSIYRRMDETSRSWFRDCISQALDEFTQPDARSWTSILAYLDVPDRDAILGDLETRSRGLVLSRDYTTLRRLFGELGILDLIRFPGQEEEAAGTAAP